MSDLISRSALLKKVWLSEDVDGYRCIVVAEDDIKAAPTIEARPVVHAKWIWTVAGDADHEQYWVCSHCKEHSFIKTRYCSDCGAIMDLESEGTDE